MMRMVGMGQPLITNAGATQIDGVQRRLLAGGCGVRTISPPETHPAAVMSALLVVDVQYDFIDGSLAVKGAQEILPVVYKLLEKPEWDLVVASQVGPWTAKLN
jgi:hypothetical protein